MVIFGESISAVLSESYEEDFSAFIHQPGFDEAPQSGNLFRFVVPVHLDFNAPPRD